MQARPDELSCAPPPLLRSRPVQPLPPRLDGFGPTRSPHLRPSRCQRLRQATRRRSPNCADLSRGRSWVASFCCSKATGASWEPARTSEQQRGPSCVGEGGVGERGVFPSVGRRHADFLHIASRVFDIGTAPYSQQEELRCKKCTADVD